MRARGRAMGHTSDLAIRRVVDANVNRALEGLRVCEDLVRFALRIDRHVRQLRSLRHAVSAQTRQLPLTATDLARARNSRQDPGRRARPSALPRHVRGQLGAKTIEHLLLVNLQRAKEALRVLEEISRIVVPRVSRGFQRLRFRLYDVERDLLITLATVCRHRSSRRRGS